MAKHNVVNLAMKSVEQVELSDAIFATKVKPFLIHEVVKAALANRRTGTASTKTRGEVKGSGVKPYRQKGTGRARHGSYVSPLFVGGGITFGPQPRDYTLKITRKKRIAALRSALSTKVLDNKFVIIDKWVEKKKTKEMAGIFKAMNVNNALIILDEPLGWLERTVKNIPDIDVGYMNALNVYNIMAHDFLICTKDVVAGLQERLEK